MAYLSFDEYTDMGGTLTAAAFNRYEFMAEKEIDRATFSRIKTLAAVPQTVKMLTYELIQIDAKADVSEDRVTGESVGGWSKSYADIQSDGYSKAKAEMIISYLSGEVDSDGVPLLYRGC